MYNIQDKFKYAYMVYIRGGQPMACVPVVPLCGTHKITIYINEESQEFTISWKYLPHLSFMPYETWPCDIVADSV